MIDYLMIDIFLCFARYNFLKFKVLIFESFKEIKHY